MNFLKELIELFSLRKVNYDSANRKTLDNIVKKTKLQERRSALFELNCEKGKKKSRVALCKVKGRPGFAQELGTLSTKALRKILKEFLQNIGLDKWSSLEGKSEGELKKLSDSKGWEHVLYMSDANVQEVQGQDEKEDERDDEDAEIEL